LIDALSVGFKPIETERLKDGKGFRFRRWHLHEISLVTVAANEQAAITNVAPVA
jgi:HK97 family phage prohead protease